MGHHTEYSTLPTFDTLGPIHTMWHCGPQHLTLSAPDPLGPIHTFALQLPPLYPFKLLISSGPFTLKNCGPQHVT